MTYIPAALWRSVISAFILVAISIPSGAHAGILGDLFASFTSKAQTAVVTLYNSQTIPLPQAAHNIDPNPSKGGGSITIVNDSALLPASGPSGSFATASKTITRKNGGQISIYIVRRGDTLGGIAKMFGVSINTIRWGNNIKKSTSIRPGQELVILPVTGIKYTVKRGGSLRDIIKIYGGNLNDAVAYNGYRADEELKAGTTVIIPDGESIQSSRTVKSSSKNRYSRSFTYSPPHNTNGPNYVGYYINPLPGGVKTQGLHGYNAVDLAAPRGTPIRAAANGIVMIARNGGWNYGYGHYVVLQHGNNTQTLYAHMVKVAVSRRQKVTQGQIIGYVGSTGNSTGPHVHFEVRGAQNPFR